MMQTFTKNLNLKSFDFISKNIFAKNEDIPKRLLEYWYYPDDIHEYLENAKTLHSFAIFEYAFKGYYEIIGKELNITPLQMFLNFVKFQIIIAKLLDKPCEYDCELIDLFDFEKYDNLKTSIKSLSLFL